MTPAQGGEGQSADTTELVRKLNARDEGISTLLLPYRAHQLDSAGEERLWEEEGWWAFTPSGFAFGDRHVEPTGKTTETHAVWDGMVFRHLQGVDRDLMPELRKRASETKREGGQTARLEILNAPQSDILLRAYMPAGFGMRLGQNRWRDLLRDSADTVAVGTEEVLGRKCSVILFDMDFDSGDDGIYKAPWAVWLDESETLLALKLESYMKPGKLGQFGATAESCAKESRTIEGQDWTCFQRWSVEDVWKAAPGIWIPKSGRISHPACPDVLDVMMEVLLDGVVVNEDLPERLLSVESPSDCRVHDVVQGREYYVSIHDVKKPR